MTLIAPLKLALSLALAVGAAAVHAQVTVSDPWVRATVAEQKATGAFMRISSAKPARVIEASSAAAGVVEIHEMSMDNNVMRMRAVKALELPAGKPVDLKPGGYHVMLMDLKAPLKAGETVPITLVVEGADKQRESIQLNATVRALTARPPQDDQHKGMKH